MLENRTNKTIAKNTLYLYVRMFLVLLVSLYTSRVILIKLGVTDYGVYNVVGGIVTMLSLFSNNLSTAVSRFLTYELGKVKEGDTERIFRCSNTIFVIFAIITFVLAETVGLWFVRYKLNIPPTREYAAFWVYQCSIVTFIISLLSSSYNALIIAHEKMQIFAYISIYEAIMKLLTVYLLGLIPFDKLIVYAVLLLMIQISVRIVYSIYCKKSFLECNHRLLWDSVISRKILGFTSWTLTSGVAVIGYNQGLNILLNLYFGPIVNASRAIASQVQGAVSLLFNNFQVAIRPQVVKLYANSELEQMHNLLLRGAKLSVYLSLLLAIPIFEYSEQILILWLKEVPNYASPFVKLVVIASCFTAMSQHTFMAIHATGNIKNFQLVESLCLISILPVAYLLIKVFHLTPVWILGVYVAVECLTTFVRVHLSYEKIQLSPRFFYSKVLYPVAKVLILSLLCVKLINFLITSSSIMAILISIMLSVIFVFISIVFCGLDSVEMEYLKNIVNRFLLNKRFNEAK